MAYNGQAEGAQKHHHHLAAIALTRAEPGEKHLAVAARQLALQPRLPNLRRYPRCRMPSLEQADRSTRNNHINWHEKTGPHRLKINTAGIIANSTFSWWDAWLNPDKVKIVISPQEWFRSASLSNEDIIPTGWLTIPNNTKLAAETTMGRAGN